MTPSPGSRRAATLRLGASAPFRLPAVVMSHGWFQTAPFEWDAAAEVLSRTERLPGGVACVAVRETQSGVVARVDRAIDERDRRELRVRLRRMLQLGSDLDGFYDALVFEPGLAGDLAAHRAGRMLAGTTLYEDVVKTICGTNTTWRQAVATIARIAAWSSDGAFTGPEEVLRAGEGRLRDDARVGYRAPFILAAARAALDGTLAEIEAAAPALDGAALSARLTGVPGVGPSSAGFLALLLGRYDQLVVDSATVRHAARAWFAGRAPTPREITDRVAPAGEWKGLALYWAMIRQWHGEEGLELP